MPQRPLEARDPVAPRGDGPPDAGVTIRPATPDDVPELVTLVNAAYRGSEGHIFPNTERIARTDAMQQLDGTLVASIGGTIAGCVHAEFNGDTAHFGLLATDVALHGRGIASALIDHVERAAREAGCRDMRIEAVKEGGKVPFYERRGYRVVRETPGQDWNAGADWGAVSDWSMVEMEKRL